MSGLLLQIRDLVKDYQALRPLRLNRLDVPPGHVVSLKGLDAAAAEMFVHLVSGAALPDTGSIVLFGTNTRDVDDAEAWLRSLDGLGLVSHRSVLVEMLTVLQNVAMPLTLELEPIREDLRPAAEALAREAGISEAVWNEPLERVDAVVNLRIRLARAAAPNPRLVIAEHPSVGLPRDVVPRVAQDVSRVMRARGTALVTLTADAEWAAHTGGDVLELAPNTGELKAGSGILKRLARVMGGRT